MSDGPGRRWAVTAAAVVAYLALGLVPIPGVDQEVLSPTLPNFWGLFNIALPVVTVRGLDIGWLVVIRLGIAWLGPRREGDAETRNLHRLGLALYLVAALAMGIRAALMLEEMNEELMAVATPGWGFRWIAAVSMMACAALVWLLASWISRDGHGRGPLVLLTAEMVFNLAGGFAVIGAGLEGGGEVWVGLVPFGYCLAPAIVLATLSRGRPSWPSESPPWLRGVRSLSAGDAVLLPWVVGLLARIPVQAFFLAAPTVVPVAPIWLDAIAATFSVFAAVVVSMWLRTRSEPSRSAGTLLAAIAIPSLGVAILAVSVGPSGLSGMLEPGLLEGERSFEIVLESSQATAAEDAQRILERLEVLEVDAEVVQAREKTIRLRIERVRSAREVVDAVVPPGRLSFQLVAEDQEPVRLAGEGLAGLQTTTEMDGWYTAPSAEALRPLVERVAVDGDHVVLSECAERAPPEGPTCCVWIVERATVLTGEDVAEAQVAIDMQDNAPYVALELSADGARRFEEATARAIRRKLAIVLDDRIVTAPIIRSRITGGRVQITLGGYKSYEELLREAHELAVVLSTGALAAQWKVQTERELR